MYTFRIRSTYYRIECVYYRIRSTYYRIECVYYRIGSTYYRSRIFASRFIGNGVNLSGIEDYTKQSPINPNLNIQ